MNDYLGRMAKPRGRPSLSDEATIRKSVSLPAPVWAAVDELRRQWPDRVPTESEAVRVLLQEALTARGVLPKTTTRQRKK